MGITGFQLARRLAEQNVHYEAAQQIIQGENRAPQDSIPEPIAADSKPEKQSPALALCNNAEAPSDLRPIPTIGTGAGKVILRDRPEGGYGDLSELPAFIFAPPYNCDLDEIAAWEG